VSRPRWLAGGVARRRYGGASRDGDHDLADLLRVRASGLFDETWYAVSYPDVASSGMDLLDHYMHYGWREGRLPSRWFDVDRYARECRDFRADRDNPLLHLLQRHANDPATVGRAVAGPERVPEPGARADLRPRRLEPGVSIAGYLCSEIGLGQAARNLSYACDAARLPLSLRNLPLLGRQHDTEFATKCNDAADRRANVVVVGLPAVDHTLRDAPGGRHNVLYPFWELARVPERWHAAIAHYDEVWAPSRFVADALAQVPGPPVRTIPQPVRLPAALPAPRPDRSALRVFTYLDFDSFVSRKNPRAAVEAFRDAFPPSVRDVQLVVKTRGTQDDGLRAWLAAAATADGRIVTVDRTVDRAEMDRLIASTDVFVSLHRSEGFGFGAAEAIAAGKVVVATDYGGTTDFVNEDTGYPVGYRLDRVPPGAYLDTDHQWWATPDHDAAVAALRAIANDLSTADLRAKRGFELLREQHSPAAVGVAVAAALAEAGALGATPAAPPVR